jgi:hypothetical protein
MNRLFHLKETYLKSISNTKSYQNREFILLSYNSKDNLDGWVQDNLKNELESGLVAYYKTTEPENFIASHAKNIAHKLASGDILCNLDCDNILVKNYCENIKEIFAKEKIIVACNPKDKEGNIGTCGMILCRKNDFYSVNGYDENINLGWGMDDTNFQFRCRMHNNLRLVILDQNYTSCLSHSNEIRTKYFKLKDISVTNDMSLRITRESFENKDYIANKNREWGKAKLIKNFVQEVTC